MSEEEKEKEKEKHNTSTDRSNPVMVITDIATHKAPTATMQGYKCLRCNHIWIPKNKSKVPEMCPACKSSSWHSKRQSKQGLHK